MKIVVIAGGLSPERDVSLGSASLIANALIDTGHRVCLADLYRGVETTDFEALFFDSSTKKRYEYTIPMEEPDLNQLKAETDNGDSLIGKHIIPLCQYADLVFIALHGDIGENGKLQAVFDAFGILYTGTGYIGSLLAMDKHIAKQFMAWGGVHTPQWELLDAPFEDTVEAVSNVGFPCVIKPRSCGSSVGVSMVNSMEEFQSAMEYAQKYEDSVLIEQKIEGREFSIGVLAHQALPLIEIIPNEGFFDYKNKYQPGFTQEICPAAVPEEIAVRMQHTALCVHKLLSLGSYSRIDFILDENNDMFCLEANTLPGMAPTSLFPQEAKAAGISYNELCDRIVNIALGEQTC